MSKINFVAGKSYEAVKAGWDATDHAGVTPLICVNEGLNSALSGAEKELAAKNGSIYRDDKIVGTTKADELVLQQNLAVTGVTVGNLINGTTVLKAGTSIESILREMLMKKIGVSKTEPTVALSGLSTKTVEYGDTVSNETLTLTLTDGKYTGQTGYSYNLAMGCTITSATIDGMPAAVATNKKSATYSYSHDAITSAVTINAGAVISAAVNKPVDNTGAEITTGLFNGATKSSNSITLTPQKKWWVGFSNTKESDMTWTSDLVRALNLSSNYVTAKSTSVIFPQGAKQQVIAVPAGVKFSAKDAAGSDITGTFVKQSAACSVECGSGNVPVNYDIYVAPANAGLAASSKATITLN